MKANEHVVTYDDTENKWFVYEQVSRGEYKRVSRGFNEAEQAHEEMNAIISDT